MTECFELIDRKLLKGPWVMGEQYTICDPRMAAGYSADEKAKLLSARRTQNHGSILYSAFSTKSLSAPDSAPQTSPLRPASCRTPA